ncbi:MAG TPA: hypothetical protein DDW76_05985 [Cyanobacteria bacterium UBA11369]|nr:hypothetical protein [Cyanobacteria bacterium UBA11371]HBE34858.1 hypothetical protein [Cyanobacteria bacterium UBA11368]HBE48355.1 hypothetical protein [Cyanobacteria bacterium UBA11369]
MIYPGKWQSIADNMPRDFNSRKQPQANKQIREIVGGRQAAAKQLEKVDPASYGKSRNLLSGAVT